jgi:hypothetical protein
MDKLDSFPSVSKALIDSLNELVPNRHPRLSDIDKVVWYNAGRRSLVDFLVDKFNAQNQNILNNETTFE